MHKEQPKSVPEASSNDTSRNVILLDGQIINITLGKDCQVVDADGTKFYLGSQFLNATNELHQSIFRVMCGTLSTHSLVYNSTIFRAFRSWLTVAEMQHVERLEMTHIESLIQIPSAYRPFITPALKRVITHKFPGLSENVVSFLTSGHKWEERGTGAYYALITNDPTRGALTGQEIHNLHSALHLSYIKGYFGIFTYALCWFFIGTGVRPIQVVRMKKSDVIIDHGPEGKEVTLRIPLAKGERASKQEYWLRRAPTVLAECLINYLDNERIKNKAPDAQLFDGNSASLSKEVTEAFQCVETYSERLEGPIPVTPYRFRYTMATRALANGASDFEVARLLTHRSTSCIQYYRASMPELQKPIRAAVGQEMEYFAKAFLGKIINDLSESSRAGEEGAVIADFMRLLGQPLGACGTRAACYQNAPIACLYCPFFEPLADAPWEDLLKSLKEDREIETEIRIQDINQNAMSAIVEIMAQRDKRKLLIASK